MNKYTKLQADIFSVFADASWEAEDISTHPIDTVANNTTSEFITIDIASNSEGINTNSVSGALIIEIYVAAGKGPSRANFIADKLDTYLVGKTFDNAHPSTTQFLGSAMAFAGRDPDFPALSRYNYSIPFNYFGVL